MRIEIHDVDHGGCASITSSAGHRLMLDCGLNLSRPWFPSNHYYRQRIDTLMLMNLDEDHCEDLPYVWDHCPLGAIVSNPTVNAGALRAMKDECGMCKGVMKAVEIFETIGVGFLGDWSNDLGGVHWHAFWNRYGTDFTDTNNLSLAVFVTFGRFTILFGGDMERAGWRQLLKSQIFCAKLATTTVYVASHHGRENGCCAEMFDLFRPEIVIFSDGAKQHGTQETRNWYANRAIGIPDYSKPGGLLGPPRRRVFTTRSDGDITMDVGNDGRYLVNWSRTAHEYPTLANLFGQTPFPSLSTLSTLAS